MILVLYSFYADLQENRSLFEKLKTQLPAAIHPSITRYIKREDQWSALLGKLLVQQGFHQLGSGGIFSPDAIQFTTYNRPYFPGTTIDFNISHSRGCVVCALSPGCRVGIDVEWKRPVEIDDFRGFLHEQEWNDIRSSTDALARFYHYWTRKEAVIKANGKGLNIPLKDLLVSNAMVFLENKKYNLQEIKIPAGYICHLAADVPGHEMNIRLQEIIFS